MSATPTLLDALTRDPARPALTFGERTLTYGELRDAAAAVAASVDGAQRVAVWAQPRIETAIAVVGALGAGATVVPVNPKAGPRELEHLLGDARPDVLLAGAGAELPSPVAAAAIPTRAVDPDARSQAPLTPARDPEATAIVLYTSGTTGPPKGVLLPHRAVESNLAALAQAWAWTAADRLVHALPLYHAHGLVLGTLGPLRLGAAVEHLGRFAPDAVADALQRGATMLFGVPTMHGRLIAAAEEDERIAGALRSARLLVSGSAALPAAVHERCERVCGQRIVERYGMSETLMIASVRADGDRRAGCVGLPLPGVEVRLLDDDGAPIELADDATIGEVAVRGPNLFTGYLNRPDAYAEAVIDGWFHTGDLGVRAADGYLRLVGRRSTDLIKSGGYKIGAGEIENALLEHAAVEEVAVTAGPDEDLGERVVAWVVLRAGETATADELADHVARLLTPHKRPRTVHFLGTLPRNELGKVRKRELSPDVR